MKYIYFSFVFIALFSTQAFSAKSIITQKDKQELAHYDGCWTLKSFVESSTLSITESYPVQFLNWASKQVLPVFHPLCFIKVLKGKKICSMCSERLDQNMLKQCLVLARNELKTMGPLAFTWYMFLNLLGPVFMAKFESGAFCQIPASMTIVASWFTGVGIGTLTSGNEINDSGIPRSALACYCFVACGVLMLSMFGQLDLIMGCA